MRGQIVILKTISAHHRIHQILTISKFCTPWEDEFGAERLSQLFYCYDLSSSNSAGEVLRDLKKMSEQLFASRQTVYVRMGSMLALELVSLF